MEQAVAATAEVALVGAAAVVEASAVGAWVEVAWAEADSAVVGRVEAEMAQVFVVVVERGSV